MPVALISGINGQDGAYLSEFLLNNDYDVHGMVRRKADSNIWRLEELGIHDSVELHIGDVTDSASIGRIVSGLEFEPFEIYNLAAQSYVKASFETPVSTFQINANGALNMLEATRRVCAQRGKTWVKFYQASTSEMFGLTDLISQNENTAFHPRSPYGVAKLAAHWAVINYRETYGLFACSGILFNHESPLRGEEFVTRKITAAVARICAGKQKNLSLGNIDAVRDWGFAGDYVKAMWLMLQLPEPDDFVVATGQAHTVREMCDIAFAHGGLDYKNYVTVDSSLFRPCEVPDLRGNSMKARKILGWSPSVEFKDLITNMVDTELKREGVVQHAASA